MSVFGPPPPIKQGPTTLILDAMKSNMDYVDYVFVGYHGQHVCDGLCVVFVCYKWFVCDLCISRCLFLGCFIGGSKHTHIVCYKIKYGLFRLCIRWISWPTCVRWIVCSFWVLQADCLRLMYFTMSLFGVPPKTPPSTPSS